MCRSCCWTHLPRVWPSSHSTLTLVAMGGICGLHDQTWTGRLPSPRGIRGTPAKVSGSAPKQGRRRLAGHPPLLAAPFAIVRGVPPNYTRRWRWRGYGVSEMGYDTACRLCSVAATRYSCGRFGISNGQRVANRGSVVGFVSLRLSSAMMALFHGS